MSTFIDMAEFGVARAMADGTRVSFGQERPSSRGESEVIRQR
jgi:hypothetical protein